MSEEMELEAEVTELIGEWLVDAWGNEDAIDFDDLLGQLDGLDLGEVLPAFRNAMALSPSGSSWWLLVPVEDWAWTRPSASGHVVIIDDDGDVEVESLAKVLDDPRFLIEPGVSVYADGWLEADDLPFRFAGDAWSRTRVDHAFGEGEWVLKVNGDETSFDLSEMELVFGTSEHALAGSWLSVGTAGVSMSTGDIGVTMYVRPSGGLFRYVWGYIDELIGHAPPDLDVDGILSEIDPESLGFSQVVSISSDTLDKERMRTAVAWVLQADINEIGHDDVEVECVGWSGTAAELLA